MKSVILALLLCGSAHAENLTVSGPFSGLNNDDSAITIDVGEAQDTLNVEVSADQQALKKRKGYVAHAALTVSSSPVTGSAYFKTSAGNSIKLFAQDVYVYKSVDGGAFTPIISTASNGTTWSFCSSAGKVFAFNTAHDTVWSYDGTDIVYYPAIPKGSLCAMTVDRMLISGTTDYPNRLYFSQSGLVTNFVVGIDPEDPGFEDIGLAGEKITSLFVNQAEWLIFKTNSMTSYQGTNQYDLVPSVISERVGMIEPHAIVQSEGVVYFKSTEGKIFGYNSGTITELSRKINGIVTDIVRDELSSKNYTSKADFDTGTYYASTGSITAGSVEPYVYTYTDTTDADFNAGTVDPALLVENGNIYIASIHETPATGGYFVNMGAESNSTLNWTGAFIPYATWESTAPSYGNYQFVAQDPTPGSGQYFWFTIRKESTDAIVYEYKKYFNDFPAWLTDILNIDMTAYEDTNYVIKTYCNYGTGPQFTSTSFTKGILAISIKTKELSNIGYCAFDALETPPAASSGTFISQIHTTAAPVPHFGSFTEISSVTAGSEINFFIRHSSVATGEFSVWQSTSLTMPTTDYAWQWRADIIASTNTAVSPYISEASLLFKSTGYWESPEYDMGAMSAWGTFLANDVGTWTYTIAMSTYAGGTSSAVREALTSGTTITASTGTYSRIRATNSFSAYSDTVRLNDVIYGWGSVPDKQATAFEYKGDIYFSVPYDNSMSNTRILKLDTKSGGWNIFNIPLNSPLSIDEYVYFGSPTSGYVYQYPVGDSDNEAAINSYWKSKNYIGTNPYVEKQFDRLSIIAGSDYGSVMNVTYNMADSGVSTSYDVSLTSTTSNFVRNNRSLPAGDRGTFFNLQIGNNAANQPWSFFGASVDYKDDPWRAQPEE